MNKKTREKLDQGTAEEKANARLESFQREERLTVLWELDKQQKKIEGAKNPVERGRIKLKCKAERLKLLRSEFRELVDDDALSDLDDLIEIAVLQEQETEYLAGFRRNWEQIKARYPLELANLSYLSFRAELQPYIGQRMVKRTPKAIYESQRQEYKLYHCRSIEYQFGGEAEVEWASRSVRNPYRPDQLLFQWEPICLDTVFAGDEVNMVGLHRFFGQ